MSRCMLEERAFGRHGERYPGITKENQAGSTAKEASFANRQLIVFRAMLNLLFQTS